MLAALGVRYGSPGCGAAEHGARGWPAAWVPGAAEQRRGPPREPPRAADHDADSRLGPEGIGPSRAGTLLGSQPK